MNLSSGEQFGRVAVACRTRDQPEERKEPCTIRHEVYEIECSKCNPPGEGGGENSDKRECLKQVRCNPSMETRKTSNR